MESNSRSSKRERSNLWVKEIEGDYFFLHNATNLSAGGMFIENSLPRKPKKEVQFSVHLPNQNEIRFTGKVVHSQKTESGEGFGIEFLEFEKGSPDDLIQI